MDLLQNFELDKVEPFFSIIAPEPLYRYDFAEDRYYYRFTNLEKTLKTWYLSVTAFCSKSLGLSPHLAKWRGDLTNELADLIAAERAAYGTLLHIETAKILRGDPLHFGNHVLQSPQYEAARAALLAGGYPVAMAGSWAATLQRDLAAICAFVERHEVEVLGIEYPIFSDSYRLAGCIDLVCRMRTDLRSKERSVCIVDLKSGKKGFYEAHELQLAAYAKMWNDWHGQSDTTRVTQVFNLAPTEWRKEPDYKLKNQTATSLNFEARWAAWNAERPTIEPAQKIALVGAYDRSKGIVNNLK